MTTIEVLILEDAAPVSNHRFNIQLNASSESEDEKVKNIDTRSHPRFITQSSIQGEPSLDHGELPSSILGEPPSTVVV